MEPLLFDDYLLREFKKGDHKKYFAFIDKNRKRLERYFPTTCRSTTSEEQTKRFVEEKIRQNEKREFLSFVICDKKENIIGYVLLKNIDWAIPKSEMGFFIDKDFEGKGVITKAVAKVIEYSFQILGINKLFLRSEESNKGSIRIAEKNGFIVEGKLRSDFKITSGELIDVLYYGLVRSGINKEIQS